MHQEEIRQDIKKQISKIDKIFNPYFSIYNFKKIIYGIDVDSLEKLLKKARVKLAIFTLLTIISSVFLIILLFGIFSPISSVVDVEKIKFLLFFEAIFFSNVFKYNNLKKNLENKIYLLRLLNKVDCGV